MKVALLFGFMYQYSNNAEVLPGVIIDIYNNYKYLEKLGYDKILVITDIINDLTMHELKFAIIRGNISTDILKFINTLKSTNNIYFYTTIEDLLIILSSYLKLTKLIYLYYSGHAINNFLVFPNINYSTSDFLSIILKDIENESQVIFIFDCCHGANFGMPLFLDNNGNFKLNNLDNPIFINHNIICIMATNKYEKSIATVHGSPFTNSLLEVLNSDKIISWIDLNQKVQELLNFKLEHLNIKQTVKIYASNINKDIWYWINHNYKGILEWNYNNNFLIIK